MIKKIIYTIVLIVFALSIIQAQQLSYAKIDTVKRTKNPKVATIMSAVIPGLGQIYNEQYWKVPLIYGGFGTMAYFVKFNNDEYQKWRTAYVLRTDGDSLSLDDYPMASEVQLQRLKDDWRRYRDLNYIGIVMLYFLNIIDANVDAHLFDYDIGDDLSLRIEPAYIDPRSLVYNPARQSYPFGIKCSIKF